jgi:hypothetical protein
VRAPPGCPLVRETPILISALYPHWGMLGNAQASRAVFQLLSLSWKKRLAYTGRA